MQFCDKCGHGLVESARFCPGCGAPRAAADSNESEGVAAANEPQKVHDRNKEIVRSALVLGVIISIGAYIAWHVPTGQSEIQHHAAVNNPFFSTKAYDSGADFYLFNRCDMFVVVDSKKYTVPGDEQNDECTLANPADAFKLTAYTRAGQS